MALMGFGDFDDMFGRVDRMMNSVMRSMMGSLPDPRLDAYDMMTDMSLGMRPGAGHYGVSVSPYSHSSHTHSHSHSSHTHSHSSRSYAPALQPSLQSFSMSTNPGNPAFAHFSSSVMTMTTDASGRPQVYEASQSTRCAPGGVQETRSSVRDSRTGYHGMSIGHHIEDRAHIMQRARNYYTGHEEENDEYLNLEESEGPTFDQEWQRRALPITASGYPGYHQRRALPRYAPEAEAPQMLALPSPPSGPTLPPPAAVVTSSRGSHSPSPSAAGDSVAAAASSSRSRPSNSSLEHLTSRGKVSHKHKHKRDKKPYRKP